MTHDHRDERQSGVKERPQAWSSSAEPSIYVDGYAVRSAPAPGDRRLFVVDRRGDAVGYFDRSSGTLEVYREDRRAAVQAALQAYFHSVPTVTHRTRTAAPGPVTDPRSKGASPARTRPWIVVVGIVAVVVFTGVSLPGWGPSRGWAVSAGGVAAGGDAPTPTRAASGQPLGTPAAVRETGPHKFLNVQASSGDPVAYDPCRPLRFVVNDAMAPAGGRVIVEEAIAVIEGFTGLRFEFEGATDEPPVEDREPFQPDRYGDRWAPVLIAWADPTQVPVLAGAIAGVAGSVAAAANHEPTVYVSGVVILDGPQLSDRLSSPGGSDRVRAVVLHELGHLVGLDHIDDPTQLMHATTAVPGLRNGDLAGLVRLGAGPCVKWL